MSLHSLPDRIANYGTPLSPSNRTRTAGDLTPTRSSVRLTVTPTWCSWLSVEPLGLSSYLISTGKAGEEVGTLRKSGEQQGGAGAREISNGEISPSFAPSGLAESITFADSNSGPTHSRERQVCPLAPSICTPRLLECAYGRTRGLGAEITI